jgi:GTPase
MQSEQDLAFLYGEEESFLQKNRIKKALLVGTYKKSTEKELCKEHLEELEQLGNTLNIETIKKLPCPLRKIDSGTFLGKGKIEEFAELKKELDLDIIIFDDDIQPSQQRNLEKILQCPVIDRTEVILDVFYQHAQTHESKIQVELARVRYQFPRLKRMWTHLSRQQGGGLFLKGDGEKQMEIDKRLLQKKLDALEKELKKICLHRETQRAARSKSQIPTFAIVGYTNSGKSSLLAALTQAEVFVKDQLFATLDTLTRRYKLSNNQDVLITDTVGFIRKIPHNLVAAFRSTLEESVQADILLHLVDSSHPLAQEQAEESLEVLKKLNAQDKPIITLLNKIDKLSSPCEANRFRFLFEKSILISAETKEGFKDLEEAMMREIANLREEISLKIPQDHYELVTQLKSQGQVFSEDYEDNDVLIKASIPKPLIYQYKDYLN